MFVPGGSLIITKTLAKHLEEMFFVFWNNNIINKILTNKNNFITRIHELKSTCNILSEIWYIKCDQMSGEFWGNLRIIYKIFVDFFPKKVKFEAKLDHRAFGGQVCQQTWPLNDRWLSLATNLTVFQQQKQYRFCPSFLNIIKWFLL